MKNKSGFYTRSAACLEKLAEGAESISFKCPESTARGLGVEWHHGGSGIIAFFPKNAEEIERIEETRRILSVRKIKSKAAAIRYLESDERPAGTLRIPYKIGKYGVFFDFWGDPDGFYTISADDPNLGDISELIGVKPA